MPYDKSGTMIIKTYQASGALPVADSIVRVYGVDEENRFIEYSILTDIDGETEILTLPTPSKQLSQSPGSNEASYAQYNIEVSAPGYYAKKIYNVAVFDNVETIQEVNMIPIEMFEQNSTYPRNNLITFVSENEMLE